MPVGSSDLLRDLGIKYPIIQAPMSGGSTTPELLAAASNAGALGSFGAAYLAPDQIASDIRAIRALTDKPFNVNLFAGGYTPESAVDALPHVGSARGNSRLSRFAGSRASRVASEFVRPTTGSCFCKRSRRSSASRLAYQTRTRSHASRRGASPSSALLPPSKKGVDWKAGA